MAGFRYVLYLPDGEPADPAMFVTAIPSWKVGDTFLAGPDLTTFRILEVEPNMDEPTPGSVLARGLDCGGGRPRGGLKRIAYTPAESCKGNRESASAEAVSR